MDKVNSIEEAAEKFAVNNFPNKSSFEYHAEYSSFIAGAIWQQSQQPEPYGYIFNGRFYSKDNDVIKGFTFSDESKPVPVYLQSQQPEIPEGIELENDDAAISEANKIGIHGGAPLTYFISGYKAALQQKHNNNLPEQQDLKKSNEGSWNDAIKEEPDQNSFWVFAHSDKPKVSGWYDTKDSGDERNTLWWYIGTGKWYRKSNSLEEMYPYHIAYWRQIPSCGNS